MSYIGGPLPGQEKEEVDLNEERLLGSRLSEQIQRGVAAIPRDKPWLNKVGKGLEWFADNSWHEGWIEAEEALIEQVGKHSPKIGVDPLIAQLAVGFMIPGPGEARTAKRVVSTGHLMKDALKAKGVVPRLTPKLVDGVKEWNVRVDQMPQFKTQLEEWLTNEYKIKGKAAKIKRQEFGTIIVDGDRRAISGITEFLERDGKLPFPPKVVTKKQHAFNRLQNTNPPKNELYKLGKELGMKNSEIDLYFEEARDGFGNVQEAARRQGLTLSQQKVEHARGKKLTRHEYTPGAYHAGHFWPANKQGATSGRTAGIEPGKLNIQKKDKFEGTINLYAAQRAGIPTTWAEDMKMWFRDKKGLPGPTYKSDFTNKQRDIIENIPWDASEDQVEAIWKKHGLDKAGDTDMIKDIQREFRLEN